ncbi:MAG: ribonuclease Y [Verrucomicrobiota bacterium]
MEVPWWLPTMFTLIGIAAGYYVRLILSKLVAATAEKTARITLEDARRESENILRESKIQARDDVIKAREAFEHEVKSRRQELLALEERLSQRETNLDRKMAVLDKKETALDEKIGELEQQKSALKTRDQELQTLMNQAREKLQQVAAMSQEDARRVLMQQVEESLRSETGAMIRRLQEEAKETSEKDARRIITLAIERYAADQVNEVTTSTVNLPNDEMKGRIIGREGRNIRALEAATGVNILIDDTPEVVVISGFDPLRREIARISLDRLMADGRIHPARIEEVVTKVQEEMDQMVMAAGEGAIYELGLSGVEPELVRTLGRLKYRHSFAQNVLQHSVEMARLMGLMASELQLDPQIAKRVGLFHDIGKALDHQVEGSHAIIGADLLRRHNEPAVVYNAVAAHHGEVEAESLYSVLATAADAISASRPGARSETTEIYLKRLEKLEAIANSFRGVEKSFAMQAGREIRVIVEPGKIDDNEAMQLARNISKEIEQQLEYPGQIKITVVRETRCVEYAR